MAAPIFKDKSIITEDITTWPKSPDRELHGQGREKFQSLINLNIFKTNPTVPVSLAVYNNLLRYFEVDEKGFYKKDPVADLMQSVANKDIYLNDTSFPPNSWWNGKTGVKKYKRVKDLTTKMHQLDNPYLFCLDKKDQINKHLNADISLSPEITDFNQGSLGNCGFVATIGCLALHPQGHNLLFSSIYPPVYNPIGIYSVRLIINSEVRYMLIDDQIPDTGYSSMTHGSEFWYFLIEKAFAKLKGGYSKLGGGMEDYLGIKSSPNISINSDNKDQLWKEKFLPIFQANHSTTYQGTGTQSNYLVNGHAYSIIDAAEWSEIRLVRLHNPWNIANYHGPFSPKSSAWEKVPKATQIDIFQRNRFSNLTFWMPYDLYVEDLPKSKRPSKYTLYIESKCNNLRFS